ncbi:hypothetical protein [Haloplanus salilacus]|uniref:hypothetical protein n=1 Tax=Haloplanus salilacus TaxID=2949994 RepID=UPI0030CC11F9
MEVEITQINRHIRNYDGRMSFHFGNMIAGKLPFLDRDVPTIIDKPIAGNLKDIQAIEDAASGTPFFGGSAVPTDSAVQSMHSSRGDRSLHCVGYDDPFYCAGHLVDTVCNIVDKEWVTVSPSNNPWHTVDIVFEEGTYANL